ncbi:FHA domain containing protein [Nitzschia inconspicua]|uniref:FHA domain containing protein n=1 Tax=Nitzschia inconspicua TaxID=303405 RepID=A0A9K3LZW8_9STRA|nr:FHA domain containing protein [Nitzschia inconspicua]
MEVVHKKPLVEDPNHHQDAAVPTMPGSGKMVAESTPEKDVTNKQQISLDMGGIQATAAFALLDGIQHDLGSGKRERVTVPITRLPAVLGRSHDTKDPNFFGLGTHKAVSRNHFKIFYRDAQGGTVEWDETKSKLEYQDKKTGENASQKLKLTKGRTEADLPTHGFFVLECLGKNPIRVNNEKVEQGECMVLESEDKLRISSYMLYFLLPMDSKPQIHKLQIATTSPKTKTASANSSKKRPIPAPSSDVGATSPKKANLAPAVQSPAEALELPITQQSDLDLFPTELLLQMMEKVVTAGIWERKHQIIGSAITLRAVKSASEAPEIQEPAIKNPGVSRQDLMDWIEKSDKYGEWVKQMLSNMEPRSYVAAITKSLLKSGWTRTDGQGRYVRWKLPPDTKIVVDVKEMPNESTDIKKETKKVKKADTKADTTLGKESDTKSDTSIIVGGEQKEDNVAPAVEKIGEEDKEEEDKEDGSVEASASMDTED